MTADTPLRLRVVLRGAVQGVGFRPFVYRLATDLGLPGWVNNTSQGVFIEVEGDRPRLETFLLRLGREIPPAAFIQSLEPAYLDPVGYTAFEIRHSEESGPKTTLVLPDLATCPDCLRELFDPADRRFRYPFTNCTNCGPRYSILEALPYDRPNTTMRRFPMCPACQAEYDSPADRRFHAQPNACPVCGPHLELWGRDGLPLADRDNALAAAALALRTGCIVAVKGLGGFHLMVDARNDSAVQELRGRKRREEKPFALMVSTLEAVERECRVSPLEARLLQSSESPIVLLDRKPNAVTSGRIAPSVAPRNPSLGVMLPYTPLHHLLLAECDFPLVATSANLTDEPICADEHDALDRLRDIADLFLVHNRPIARPVDDSVTRVVMGRELVLRRARGYAPLPIPLREPLPPTLAVGAHLKNTVAAAIGSNVFLSPHIGDLETDAAYRTFLATIQSFRTLFDFMPGIVVHDAHPDYLSTRYAEECGLPTLAVQHHYAHALACLAENEVTADALAVTWDGTGYGADGTVWGGEFLKVTHDGFARVGHLRPFLLPGGDGAVKEPRRSALGLLVEAYGATAFMEAGDALPEVRRTRDAFEPSVLKPLLGMLTRGVHSPVTTSAGRLFDAASFLAGLRAVTRFEGQAAMELEFALAEIETAEAYPFPLIIEDSKPIMVDWLPAMRALSEEGARGEAVGLVSARFHNGLAEAIVAVAERGGLEAVALTGGCFQNRALTERAVTRLREAGFRPYWHQRVPPNDGGIALGQAMAALQGGAQPLDEIK